MESSRDENVHCSTYFFYFGEIFSLHAQNIFSVLLSEQMKNFSYRKQVIESLLKFLDPNCQ
jgi:hypothetical protein